MSQDVIASEAIAQWSTEKLKQELLKRTATKDTEPLKQKVDLAKELAPLFAELSRDPYPDPNEQIPLVLGVWKARVVYNSLSRYHSRARPRSVLSNFS